MKISFWKLSLIAVVAALAAGTVSAQSDTDKALDAFMVKGWPSGKVSPTIPEYTGGKIVNSGGDSRTYYIKVRETSSAALVSYLGVLKKAGWVVNDASRFPTAEKGLVKLDFNWEGDTALQIAVRQEQESQWPTGQLPPEVVAPPQARFGGEISIQTTEEDRLWYFTFKCLGLAEADARAWLRSLLQRGWEGDENQLSRKFTWKGRKMSASLEIYETNGDSTSFTYNYGVDD